MPASRLALRRARLCHPSASRPSASRESRPQGSLRYAPSASLNNDRSSGTSVVSHSRVSPPLRTSHPSGSRQEVSRADLQSLAQVSPRHSWVPRAVHGGVQIGGLCMRTPGNRGSVRRRIRVSIMCQARRGRPIRNSGLNQVNLRLRPRLLFNGQRVCPDRSSPHRA